MQQCPNCGASINNHYECEFCGWVIPQQQNTPNPPILNNAAPYHVPPTNSGNGSLVCGIIGLILSLSCYFSFVGVILGIMAMVFGGKAKGAGNAKAGKILGVFAIIIGIIATICLIVVMALAVTSSMDNSVLNMDY